MEMTGVTWRWYPGNEVQGPDPFISAKMGAANTPAYRGTAYVVFEELNLSAFGNRLPQISFEVFRPLADPDTAEGLVKALTMIPASGEFTYATAPVKKSTGSSGATVAENLNAITDTADIVVALDRLQSLAPAVESVSLVVAWFGDDLRAGNCKVRPGVEVDTKTTTPSAWVVNCVSRANAFLVSRDAEDRPVYGGTPADFAVVQAIQEMKARGLRVTFYPFLLLDVPPGNTKPNPYSANATTSGQPTFPWRGRITCSPAAGFAGSVDKTATAATQVAALFGTATRANFSMSGTNVSWTGLVGEWSLRRMILHYAHLCKAAGGVDTFLIGSEMPGLTTIRSGASTYPAVTAFKALAADVRAILGAGPKIGYAADWSEYFGHHPADGSGDRHGFGGGGLDRHGDHRCNVRHGHRGQSGRRDQDPEPWHGWRIRIDHGRQHRVGDRRRWRHDGREHAHNDLRQCRNAGRHAAGEPDRAALGPRRGDSRQFQPSVDEHASRAAEQRRSRDRSNGEQGGSRKRC